MYKQSGVLTLPNVLSTKSNKKLAKNLKQLSIAAKKRKSMVPATPEQAKKIEALAIKQQTFYNSLLRAFHNKYVMAKGASVINRALQLAEGKVPVEKGVQMLEKVKQLSRQPGISSELLMKRLNAERTLEDGLQVGKRLNSARKGPFDTFHHQQKARAEYAKSKSDLKGNLQVGDQLNNYYKSERAQRVISKQDRKIQQYHRIKAMIEDLNNPARKIYEGI